MINFLNSYTIKFEGKDYSVYTGKGIKFITSSDYAKFLNSSENQVKVSLGDNLNLLEEHVDYVSLGNPINHHLIQPLGYDLLRELRNKNNAFLISASGVSKLLNIKRDIKITTQKIEKFFLAIFEENSYKFVNTVSSKEGRFIELLRPILKDLKVDFETQFWVLNRKYRLDLFIKDLNLVVEFDEDTHEKAKNYLETDEIRQREIESEMGVVFIRVKEKTHMGESLSSVIKKVLQLKYGILGD